MIIIPFRLRCFLTHLAISVLIALSVLAVVFFVWYPAPFARVLGVSYIMWMMLAIDVVLGPLLTLLVAKQGKKTLKMDLAVIVLVQLVALAYGLYSIEKARPIAVAYDVNRFEVVQKFMVQTDTLDHPQLIQPFNQHQSIPFVFVKPAKDAEDFKQRMSDELQHGISASSNPMLYEPLNQKNMAAIVENSRPIADLYQYNDKAMVDEIKARFPTADSYALVVSTNQNICAMIDSKSGEILQLVNLRPW